MRKLWCVLQIMLLMGAAQATVYVSENFNNRSTGNVHGQGPWHGIYGSSPVVTESGVFGRGAVWGGANGGVARPMGLTFDPQTDDGPLYLSALVTWDGANADAVLTLGVSEGGNTNKFEGRLEVDKYYAYLRGPGYPAGQDHGPLTAGTTYLAVVKVQENPSDPAKLDLTLQYFDVSGGSLGEEDYTGAWVYSVNRTDLNNGGTFYQPDEVYFGINGAGLTVDNVTVSDSWADVQASVSESGAPVVPRKRQLALLDGITHYWSMNGYDGQVLYDEGLMGNPPANGTPVTNNQPPRRIAGKFGDAVEFPNASVANGARMELGLPDTLNGPGSFSISLWCRHNTGVPGGAGNYTGIMFRRNPKNDGLGYNAGGNWDYRQNNGSGYMAQPGGWNLSHWYHATLVYDSEAKTKTLYVDGRSQSWAAEDLGVGDPDPALHWKNWSFAFDPTSETSNRYYNGSVDEVVVWNRALSADEVAALDNGGDGLEMASLIPEIVLAEGVGQTLDIALAGASPNSVTVDVICPADPNAINPEAPDYAIGLSANPLEFANSDAVVPLVLTAVDDRQRQGDRQYILFINSRDPNVVPDPHVVRVTIEDDDAPGIILTDADDLYAMEGDPTGDTFTIELAANADDNADVTIQMSVDADYLTVTPPEVVLNTPGVPATVTVTAVDNAIVEADLVPYTEYPKAIAFSVSSTDPLYDALTIDDVTVTIGENDCGALGFDPMDANEDCTIGLDDLMAFAQKWLQCYYPNRPAGECPVLEQP